MTSGYSLIIYDTARPMSVQQKMWEVYTIMDWLIK